MEISGDLALRKFPVSNQLDAHGNLLRESFPYSPNQWGSALILKTKIIISKTFSAKGMTSGRRLHELKTGSSASDILCPGVGNSKFVSHVVSQQAFLRSFSWH
jgi:hypothetical protein